METDFRINSKPVSISFECPHCEMEVTLKWDTINVPDSWSDNWGSVECPECGKEVELGECEYD